MKLLDAVNKILPKLGEHTVTSLESKHPTVDIIVTTVAQVQSECLLDGWWFNTFDTTLYPGEDSSIDVPADTLSIVTDRVPTAVRGNKLMNMQTGTYDFSEALTARRIANMPFDQLPESAATYVFYTALVDAYVTDIGLESDVRQWQAKAAAASIQLESEHLKQRRYSTVQSPRAVRYNRARFS